ncbi:hypothetical protein OIDMADRAFT_183016 [Oidiodendron maius Zn]|uniref:Heterokaryon incompatibility domain-containing protein n=1 Tax=Oidiodendron maius (strain Zn) TaxID=913774 RepID=A0A0C3H329_OIDMZ|nr:hypothetical protein OIDMADRAFT_183016 [Oidiodendron maius Zn]
MQRDIDLTIGDVIVEGIRSYALSQVSENITSQDTHTNLRFLKITNLEQYSDLYPTVTCELTEKGEHPGENSYVAVSYCWESFTSLGLAADSRSSPTVLVEQRGKPPRPPRCPANVLIRAIAFAVSRGVSFIWIDQECVNQEDPIDVQNHLQWNHAIFRQAEFAIGLLNFELYENQVDYLITLELFHRIYDPDPKLADEKLRTIARYGLKSILRDIQRITRLLKAITRDRWFTRAWVFQERISANVEMHLLLPLSTEALKQFPHYSAKELVGEDYLLSVESVCSIAIALRIRFSEGELAQKLQEDITVKDTIYESLNSLHEVAQLLCGPICAETSFDRLFERSEEIIGRQKEINNFIDPLVHKVFLEIESCDSRVVSDRVAILSNIMGFEQRFLATSCTSYSFALVKLLFANNHLPSVLIREENPKVLEYLFSRPVNASLLIIFAHHLKEEIAGGKVELQKELENVSSALTDFFGRDITRHENFPDILEDAVEGLRGASYKDPLSLLSEINVQSLKFWDVIPMSATIGDLMGGMIGRDHIDKVSLQSSHADAIIRHGIATNQLSEGVEFMAFTGTYRWRPEFIDKFFD